MRRRLPAITFALAVALSLLPAATLAAKPERQPIRTTDRFHDDFILDMCGIDTWTTVTERWTLKTWPDGSQTFHTRRTFVPDDVRIPIEKAPAPASLPPMAAPVSPASRCSCSTAMAGSCCWAPAWFASIPRATSWSRTATMRR